jgi:hypothetical protein
MCGRNHIVATATISSERTAIGDRGSDSSNYQQLVTALITAVGGVGALAGYPVVQAISEIANRVIAAMPADWFANDDYVDSFYTIENTVSYNGLVGAGGNATVSLQPFLLAPNE